MAAKTRTVPRPASKKARPSSCTIVDGLRRLCFKGFRDPPEGDDGSLKFEREAQDGICDNSKHT